MTDDAITRESVYVWDLPSTQVYCVQCCKFQYQPEMPNICQLDPTLLLSPSQNDLVELLSPLLKKTKITIKQWNPFEHKICEAT